MKKKYDDMIIERVLKGVTVKRSGIFVSDNSALYIVNFSFINVWDIEKVICSVYVDDLVSLSYTSTRHKIINNIVRSSFIDYIKQQYGYVGDTDKIWLRFFHRLLGSLTENEYLCIEEKNKIKKYIDEEEVLVNNILLDSHR